MVTIKHMKVTHSSPRSYGGNNGERNCSVVSKLRVRGRAAAVGFPRMILSLPRFLELINLLSVMNLFRKSLPKPTQLLKGNVGRLSKSYIFCNFNFSMTRRLEETGLDGQTEKKKELVTVCRVFNL
jgi:hypothetical protein